MINIIELFYNWAWLNPVVIMPLGAFLFILSISWILIIFKLFDVCDKIKNNSVDNIDIYLKTMNNLKQKIYIISILLFISFFVFISLGSTVAILK